MDMETVNIETIKNFLSPSLWGYVALIAALGVVVLFMTWLTRLDKSKQVKQAGKASDAEGLKAQSQNVTTNQTLEGEWAKSREWLKQVQKEIKDDPK